MVKTKHRLGMRVFIIMAAFLPWSAHGAQSIDRSVVKVISVAAGPSYSQPWQTGSQNLQTGSGAVISPGMVLTNAHVVTNQTFVQVQRQGDPTKYPAEVAAVGHECDLALLKVADPEFMKGVKPLGIGKMPVVRDKVAAYGFPIGGDKLSITEGVVSRIEMGQYSHCWKTLPLIQIDAAINPGNSGGPVIKSGKIAGVAFQGMGQAENVGYMIPPPVIRHFLKDIEDGEYDGFPALGIQLQTLENPGHRRSLGMGDDRTGVLVTRIIYDSSVWGALKPGDVILEVEGRKVANDGTVPFTGGERIMFSYFLASKFIGDQAALKVLRDGREENISVLLKASRNIISTCEFDVMPSYYIFGGLVFSSLSLNYLQTWEDKWWYASPVELRYHLYNDIATPERQQVVILQYALADEINVGYHDVRNEIIVKVNGRNITGLEDLVKKIEGSSAEFIEFETESGEMIVLSSGEAVAANPRIMERYRVPADRSQDLK